MVELLYRDQKTPVKEREEFLIKVKNLFRKSITLETCNRVEVYYGEGEIPYSTARHLFRVVSGLESSLIGEIAIQGQVKTAYKTAVKERAVSSSLHQLFQYALFVGKKIRTETSISRGAMSHSQAAVDLLLQKDIHLKEACITLIGVHNMNDKILLYLARKGASNIYLGNRTFTKAEYLAHKNGAKAFPLENLSEVLKISNIVISATSAPHRIIKKEQVPLNRKILFLDLAVPGDIDESIGTMKNCSLYNICDIEQAITKNSDKRNLEVYKAEKIIDVELQLFFNKRRLAYA